MNDSPKASVLRSPNQSPRVFHRSFKGGLPTRESHPIRVDQRGNAVKRLRQSLGMFEVVRKNLNFVAEWTLSFRMICQRADSISPIKQNPRGIFPRVA